MYNFFIIKFHYIWSKTWPCFVLKHPRELSLTEVPFVVTTHRVYTTYRVPPDGIAVRGTPAKAVRCQGVWGVYGCCCCSMNTLSKHQETRTHRTSGWCRHEWCVGQWWVTCTFCCCCGNSWGRKIFKYKSITKHDENYLNGKSWGFFSIHLCLLL